jgi:hypothetical protein
MSDVHRSRQQVAADVLSEARPIRSRTTRFMLTEAAPMFVSEAGIARI